MSVAVAAREPGLRLSYARAQLAELERMRQIYLAHLEGMPQRDIGRAAHLSQASVHRVIVRAKSLGMEHESIEEIVLQRFVGRISAEVMVQRLVGFDHWIRRVVDPVDGVLAEDSQAELEALLDDGFISEAEVDQVLDAHD